MHTLVDYVGLAEHLHIESKDCIALLSDQREMQKQQAKNPEYFIPIDDEWTDFFRDWRRADANERTQIFESLQSLAKRADETNTFLGLLLPTLTSIIKGIDIMSVNTDKLTQEVGVLIPLVDTLITSVGNIKALNDQLAADKAAGLVDDAAIDANTQAVDAEITKAQVAIAAATPATGS